MSIPSAAASKLLSHLNGGFFVVTFNSVTFKLEQLVKRVTCLSMDWLHCGKAEGPEKDSHTAW